MESWKFLYTKLASYKKAVTKTGSPERGKTKFVITEGINYSDCLKKAKKECGFNDNQLLGSRKI